MLRTVRTNLKGFKDNFNWEHTDFSGFFTHKGRDMTDLEIRYMIDYGISHGYEYDADIPDSIIERIIKYCNPPKENVIEFLLFEDYYDENR